MDFTVFSTKVNAQFNRMAEGEYFKMDIDKQTIFDFYLNAFPEGTNEIYKERREYDCNCCKQFIRNIGNVASIVDGKIVTVWDIDIGGHFQVVADKMAELVRSTSIREIYRTPERKFGAESTLQQLEDNSVINWNHFHIDVPNKIRKNDHRTVIGNASTDIAIFKRSLEEITLDAAMTVLELIDQNSLYRGEEHKSIVTLFVKQLKAYNKLSGRSQGIFCWEEGRKLGGAARIRNTVIGTLLVDISDGKTLDWAVTSFEQKVAPSNYKRPKALVTKGMIKQAQKKVAELGIESALPRRFAVTDDLTINNVLFADRSVKKQMNVFDEMLEATPLKKNLSKIEEVSAEDFISKIVPTSTSISLMMENKHTSNLVSLIAPVDAESKNILKWDNNFSWAYNGEVTDSMKERVKSAGGNVDGVLRFSIQWNDKGDNRNDLDAHCVEPKGNRIYFGNKGRKHTSSGMLDVDIVSPGDKVAVENIIYTDVKKMPDGNYEFLVHNYSERGGRGFTAEIEFDGKIYSYSYAKGMRRSEYVSIATVNYTKKAGFKLGKSLPNSETVKEVWGVNTQTYQKVNMIMNSPNHWDSNRVGNKHLFFMLENCKQEGSVRGLFNEFLSQELTPHRKVFEVLGSKIRVPESDDQLSGIGFSSTLRNSAVFRVTGKFERTIKVNF